RHLFTRAFRIVRSRSRFNGDDRLRTADWTGFCISKKGHRQHARTLFGGLHLWNPPPFTCDLSLEGKEPGIPDSQVFRQRPADPADFRILVKDAVPSVVEQAEEQRPDKQRVEVVGLW